MQMKYLVSLLLVVGCFIVKAQSIDTINTPPPDPFFTAVEQSFIGAYYLDDVLLAPGKSVMLTNSVFGFGDVPAQAATNGLTAAQTFTLLQTKCTLDVLANHSFIISNLPAADFSKTISITGSWVLEPYQVSELYHYRITMNDATTGNLRLATFFSGDLPNPPIIQIYYREGQDVKADGGSVVLAGQNGIVDFRFAKINMPPLFKR